MEQSSSAIVAGSKPVGNGSVAGALHTFSFELKKPSATLHLTVVCKKSRRELAKAVLDVQMLRDRQVTMWALAADGGVQSDRRVPDTGTWMVRCSGVDP